MSSFIGSNKAGIAPVAAVEITKNSSSTSYVRRVPMEQPIPAGMSSTVIVNNKAEVIPSFNL